MTVLGSISHTPEWRITVGKIAYPEALAEMERRVAAIQTGQERELVWLLEHPPLYTAGTSAKLTDLLSPNRFPVYRSGRGGQWTYHGPGQRVAYVMLDLRKPRRLLPAKDLRAYVTALEEWLIRTLAVLGVHGERRKDRIGVWVEDPAQGEAKIAAIGVRVSRWVTWHGVALNVAPDLEHFTGIIPCGIQQFGVTSLAKLGIAATMTEVDAALQATWPDVFGAL
ncbi:MAG: lipoyl(octanoyl) transferase LipB [Acidobacteriia bacterium]|nr:lipoyl(octanoyl) transferase LipB [Methyloceanibacter sp.]MBX5471126.1 lipoyl(octanoyl) transferase LipB [Acetobacteraceae bacterium]MCL6490920.1 lipoyl(octanoyl) transferase LipB [Terriglobia bacterium]